MIERGQGRQGPAVFSEHQESEFDRSKTLKRKMTSLKEPQAEGQTTAMKRYQKRMEAIQDKTIDDKLVQSKLKDRLTKLMQMHSVSKTGNDNNSSQMEGSLNGSQREPESAKKLARNIWKVMGSIQKQDDDGE